MMIIKSRKQIQRENIEAKYLYLQSFYFLWLNCRNFISSIFKMFVCVILQSFDILVIRCDDVEHKPWGKRQDRTEESVA